MSVTINISAPKKMIKDVEDFYKETAWMANIVEAIRDKIKENTSEGKDYRSRNFHKYSNAYAKRKGQTKVDLELSGTMMKSVKAHVVNPLTGIVYVKANMGSDGKNRAVLAEYHNYGQGRNPEREFMNVSEKFKDKVVKKYIDDEVQKIINKHR